MVRRENIFQEIALNPMEYSVDWRNSIGSTPWNFTSGGLRS